MFDLIASSFFQKKSCRLPGIGNLELVSTPAEYDFPNRQIRAPRQTILFIPSRSADNGFNEFSAISNMMKDELDKKGKVEVTGLGVFTRGDDNVIQFNPETISEDFLQPVAAEKVIHKDSEHSILVGDKETTNVEMNEYYSDDVAEESKLKWWLWAAVAGAVGIAVIAMYIYQHGLNDFASKSSF